LGFFQKETIKNNANIKQYGRLTIGARVKSKVLIYTIKFQLTPIVNENYCYCLPQVMLYVPDTVSELCTTTLQEPQYDAALPITLDI
jgi:hypothetical protein